MASVVTTWESQKRMRATGVNLAKLLSEIHPFNIREGVEIVLSLIDSEIDPKDDPNQLILPHPQATQPLKIITPN